MMNIGQILPEFGSKLASFQTKSPHFWTLLLEILLDARLPARNRTPICINWWKNGQN